MQDGPKHKKKDPVSATAWIFDIDGVITDPTEKRVKEPKILSSIAEKLKDNEPVAFNTGRSSSWIKEKVLNPLFEIVDDKKIFDNFIVVAEKGGAWITFDKKGESHMHKDELLSVPQDFKQKIKELVAASFARSMFYDDTKEIIATIEMKDRYDLEEFKKDQLNLVKEINKIIKQDNLEDSLKIDSTNIATDIESKHLGKGFSIERILELFKEKNISANQFIAFGDSPSDIDMAEKLQEKNLAFTFIFVDDRGHLEGLKKPYPIVYTGEKFDKGTLEYLNNS